MTCQYYDLIPINKEPCKSCENDCDKKKDKIKDNVNPDHYKNSTSLECIQVMEISFGIDCVVNFCKVVAFKYLWRYKNKNGMEDLEKANWYLNYINEKARNGSVVLSDVDKRQINTMKTFIANAKVGKN